jgi:hypothetical protein
LQALPLRLVAASKRLVAAEFCAFWAFLRGPARHGYDAVHLKAMKLFGVIGR